MLYVQIIDGEVKNVWDTQPPAGEDNWFEAIEVRPQLSNNQNYGSHYFDLTKRPVQIIWEVINLSVEERKANLLSLEEQNFLQKVSLECKKRTNNIGSLQYDSRKIDEAKIQFETNTSEIINFVSHEDIDAFEGRN